MLALNNDYIGYDPFGHNTYFTGSDSEELYQQNLKTQPIDWYYRDKQIIYNRNSNGHRCKEVEDIDLDNYILFSGCSHSEGIGLKLEDSHPYLVSKSLGCDYYNLSLGGTGYDVLAHNLITWFAKVKSKPKVVVIQWPEYTRFISKSSSNVANSLMTYGSWSSEVGIDKFCVIGHDIGFFETRRTMVYTLIKNFIKCPIIEVAYSNAIFNNDTVLLTPTRKDYARDGMHFGILSNSKYASVIAFIIKDKYKHELNNN
jgi:hypothetical protein